MERSQATYRVVINNEQQYSVWPANASCPKGGETRAKLEAKTSVSAIFRKCGRISGLPASAVTPIIRAEAQPHPG